MKAHAANLSINFATPPPRARALGFVLAHVGFFRSTRRHRRRVAMQTRMKRRKTGSPKPSRRQPRARTERGAQQRATMNVPHATMPILPPGRPVMMSREGMLMGTGFRQPWRHQSGNHEETRKVKRKEQCHPRGSAELPPLPPRGRARRNTRRPLLWEEEGG